MSEAGRDAAEIRLLGIPVFRREDKARLIFAAVIILTTAASWYVPVPLYHYMSDIFWRLQYPSALAVFALGYGILVPYVIGSASLYLYILAIQKSWQSKIDWLWRAMERSTCVSVLVLASGAVLLIVSTKLPWKNKEYRLLRESWRSLAAWLVSLALILAIAYFEPSAKVYFSGTQFARAANLLFMCIAIAAGVETSATLWACGMRRTAIANCLFWCSQTWFLVYNATHFLWSRGFFGGAMA